MNDTSSHDEKKVKAAYAASVPFLLALAILLVLVYTDFEVGTGFIGIVFGASIVLAVLLFALIAGRRERR